MIKLRIIIVIMVLATFIGCRYREQALYGLWQINYLSFENKNPYICQSDYYDDWFCGQTSYTIKIEVAEAYISFIKDKQY